MENQSIEGIEMMFSKPLAMSAMKRDGLSMEDKIIEEVSLNKIDEVKVSEETKK